MITLEDNLNRVIRPEETLANEEMRVYNQFFNPAGEDPLMTSSMTLDYQIDKIRIGFFSNYKKNKVSQNFRNLCETNRGNLIYDLVIKAAFKLIKYKDRTDDDTLLALKIRDLARDVEKVGNQKFNIDKFPKYNAY